jgi:protein XagA
VTLRHRASNARKAPVHGASRLAKSLKRWARTIARVAAAAIALSVAPMPARAGAWVLEPGRTQVIFQGTALDAPRRFDRRGRALRAGRFSKQEFTVLAEHGFQEALTLIAGGSIRAIAFDGATGTNRSAAGALVVGARGRLWTDGATVVSAQATVAAGGERSLPGNLRALDAPAEADARLLLGHGFALAGRPAFAEVQTGYRWRGGGHADEIRIDATLGLRPWPTILIMLQSFNTIAVAGDGRFGGGRLRQHKIQPSLVWDFHERWSLQLGVFASLAGRDTLRERGAVAALWWRF